MKVIYVCVGCRSKGFEPSILGDDRCTFCDGSAGGNAPCAQCKEEFKFCHCANPTQHEDDPEQYIPRARNTPTSTYEGSHGPLREYSEDCKPGCAAEFKGNLCNCKGGTLC